MKTELPNILLCTPVLYDEVLTVEPKTFHYRFQSMMLMNNEKQQNQEVCLFTCVKKGS